MIRAFVVVVLCIHAAMLGWMAWADSATWDEVGHFAAGLSHWELGRFDYYRVNPPLVRTVAATPLLITPPKTDWTLYHDGPWVRPEYRMGTRLISLNGERYFWYLTLCRWAAIPFSILGGWCCYRWAADLNGPNAGCVAVSLWCFDPNLLGHGHLISADVGAASCGVLSAWSFWKWLREPSYRFAVLAGIALGIAELTKSTWCVLYGAYPTMWVFWRCTHSPPLTWLRSSLQLLTILTAGVFVLNAGYGFEGTGRRLDSFQFVSLALSGNVDRGTLGETVGNRFAGTLFGSVPVPLPANYVAGIDEQKVDFEKKMWSYLRGEHRKGGWWYYYLYALAIKTPIGTLALAAVAAFITIYRFRRSATWKDEVVLLLPAVIVITLVSVNTGFNHHMRYVFPAFPFIFIWSSKLVTNATWLRAFAILATSASVVSSLSVFPHSLSYFNELVGGPTRGHLHIDNTNIDMGQDLFYLKSWLDKHPEVGAIGLAYLVPIIDPHAVGIKFTLPPPGPDSDRQRGLQLDDAQTGPLPGWYVVSVNLLHSRTREYTYFNNFKPVDSIGYSMYVYHIEHSDANQVRAELGLQPVR